RFAGAWGSDNEKGSRRWFSQPRIQGAINPSAADKPFRRVQSLILQPEHGKLAGPVVIAPVKTAMFRSQFNHCRNESLNSGYKRRGNGLVRFASRQPFKIGIAGNIRDAQVVKLVFREVEIQRFETLDSTVKEIFELL